MVGLADRDRKRTLRRSSPGPTLGTSDEAGPWPGASEHRGACECRPLSGIGRRHARLKDLFIGVLACSVAVRLPLTDATEPQQDIRWRPSARSSAPWRGPIKPVAAEAVSDHVSAHDRHGTNPG